jgi:MYXO-CTERM domain-containing protein
MYRAALLLCSISLISFAGNLGASPVYENALPNIFLNQQAGDLRSNIAFTEDDPIDNFDGTDVKFSSSLGGDIVNVDSLTTWSVASILGDPLGFEFDSVSLYFRTEGGTWQILDTGTPDTFFDVSNPNQVDNSNPDITDTIVPYTNSVSAYESTDPGQAGTFYPLWQTTFSNLSLTLTTGVVYQFAVWGTSANPDPNSLYGYWFSSYSNALLSGAIEDSFSGTYLRCDATNLSAPCFVEDPLLDQTWDKGANMNIEIDGTVSDSAPEPSTSLMAGTALLGLAVALRRRGRQA